MIQPIGLFNKKFAVPDLLFFNVIGNISAEEMDDLPKKKKKKKKRITDHKEEKSSRQKS